MALTVRFSLPRLSSPVELTTYDLVKCLAIVLMIVDHVGYFFYPADPWFRVFGRACLPIWFFLVGYAASRDLSSRLWLWAGIVALNSLLLGGAVFPVNVLLTILLIRMSIDRIAALAFKDWDTMLYTFVVLAVLAVPTAMVVEYGTAAWLLALFGYVMRHEEELSPGRMSLYIFSGATVAFFAINQFLLFHRVDPAFGMAEMQGIFLLVTATALMMARFRPLLLEGLSDRLPGPFAALIRFGGRYTLEIYGIHLILFRLTAILLERPGHEVLSFHWVY